MPPRAFLLPEATPGSSSTSGRDGAREAVGLLAGSGALGASSSRSACPVTGVLERTGFSSLKDRIVPELTCC